MSLSQEVDFPWDIGIQDAHCHPTDTMASIASIAAMKTATLTVMATRAEDQDLVQQVAQSINSQENAISASSRDRIVPCFGWHPWFSHQIFDDTQPGTRTVPDKHTHYSAVLSPGPHNDTEFTNSLPSPKPLSQLIAEIKARLQQFPHALVGEIGLDKTFRLPSAWTGPELDNRDEELTTGSREGRKLTQYRVNMQHQTVVLKAQLKLAGELGRPVSVHSVQAHGVVLKQFQELWTGYELKIVSRRKMIREKDAEGAFPNETDNIVTQDRKDSASAEISTPSPLPFPTRICMHSYSGPVEPIRQFLNRTNPSQVYFSFSYLINFERARGKKACDVIKAVPEDRILVESDLNMAGPEIDDLIEKAARQVCELRGWELKHGVKILSDNWKRFIFG
ncbi:TatD family [Penicillium taxi]|uniref:TatD family n=1 Tax=Penicillium taxi TaxID=168475 RepID=UPI0025455076|nr:TatD family [Penicillium taxi]KAJ5893766.1 TatD family [Penicillium taxi]